jgi:hypothetical protein
MAKKYGRAMTDDEVREFLFPMPEAEEREVTPFQEFEAFRADCERFGGLFRISDAAKILGVSDGTIRSYAKRGIVETVNHFGGVWVPGVEVERRLTRPRGPGRPPKRSPVAVPA